MIGPIFFQTEDPERTDQLSYDTGHPGGGEELTRQEFKDEADLNVLLNRYGVYDMRPPQWGEEIDWNMDLQQAFQEVKNAKKVQLNLPDELKEKYPDWRSMMTAAASGELDNDLQMVADWRARQAEAKPKQGEEKKQENVTG